MNLIFRTLATGLLTFGVMASVHLPHTFAEKDKGLVLFGPNKTTAVIRADKRKRGSWNDYGADRILQRFVQVMTGRKVPILFAADVADAEARKKYDVRIWCGRQPEVDRVLGKRLDTLDDDGYIIHADGADLYLAGRHWWGSNWAAYHLLETFAGCRWYLDEPVWHRAADEGLLGPGDIIPKSDVVVVPRDVDITEEPDYRSRWFRRVPAHSFRVRYRDKFHHFLGRILPPDLFAEHPEFFPEIDGKREKPKSANDFQPCVSNPDVMRHVADYAIRHFNTNPDAGSLSLGMNDSSRFCRCQKCLAAAPSEIADPEARIAWGFFDFYNRVAREVVKQHPEKRLGCLAYARLRLLPKDSIKLHPNVVPYLTLDSAQLYEKKARDGRAAEAAQWKRISQRMGIYEYLYGAGFIIPRIYNRSLADNIKRRYGVNADGFYAEAYPNWGLDGPKYWLVSKLLWDTTLDPDELLDQFYGDMFGRTDDSLSPAAVAMKSYFELLEEAWTSQTLPSVRGNYRWYYDPRQLEIFPPDVCDKAWNHLQEAERLAESDAVRKRIAFFRTSFNITRIACHRYALKQKLDAHRKAQPDDLSGALALFSEWSRAGDLQNAVEAARKLDFAAFTNTSSKEDGLDSVPAFDRQPVNAVNEITQRLVDLTAQRGPFGDRSEFLTAAKAVAPGELPQRVTDMIDRGLVFVTPVDSPPKLDGTIEEREWGWADFNGHFLRFTHINSRSASLLDGFAVERTRFWTRGDDRHLYFAFDLEQKPSTIGADVTDRDTTNWQNPDMRNDDCIVLTFHSPRWAPQTVRVNVNGAVSDFQHNGPGLDWNAAEAATRRTKNGWQVELRLDRKKLNLVTSLNDPKQRPEVSISRYTRQPVSKPADAVRAEATTLVPFTSIGGGINGGNHPRQMVFRTGSRVVLSRPLQPESNGQTK